jgi:hypothetical protein
MRILISLGILLLPLSTLAAEPLGRLFFTPEQRAQLDSLRTKKVVAAQVKDEPAPEFITFNGLIRRDDGKTTIWVNNKALSEADLRDQQAIAGSISRDGKIRLGSDKGSMQLKVGQRAELLSGRIEEAYSAQRSTSAPSDNTKPKTNTNLPGKPATDPPSTKTATKKDGEESAPADREATQLRDRINDVPAK